MKTRTQWHRLGFIALAIVASASTKTTGKEWQSQRIHERFYAEGASAGDIDGDGQIDLVSGPIWFRGPSFTESFELAPAREFSVAGYSDQFFSRVIDVDADGNQDVIAIGFPGKSARLYLNPGSPMDSKHWVMTEIAGVVDNESAAIVELIGGGLPEIVCGRDSQYGFYRSGNDPTEPWVWNPVSRPEVCPGKFAHGLGVGDLNNDGLADIIDKQSWWEQPAKPNATGLWEQHTWAPRSDMRGGAQIHAADIDGDGDSDIVTSLDAHGYGLSWFEQTQDHRFREHTILGSSSTDNDYGVVFSQLHAVDLTDVNGDGLEDIVTGKRYLAHNGKDVGGLQQAVLYWFECVRGADTADGGTHFVPHRIDDDSGVGVDVLVTDLNGDQKPDVVSCSKRGLSIHFQNDLAEATRPKPWRQTAGRDQSKYASGTTPEEAARNLMVDDGMSVDLIASEPELTQPIAMCFDAKGRLWVIEGHTYPTKAPKGEGKDRIVFFEDADADGSFETKKTFLEGVNLASGIEVGFGGVWVGAAPELLFVPDADHDGTPDGPPQILLDGWGYQDTHETLNSFTWGPDGWLYGCHGVFTHSHVGKPTASEDQRQKLNAGVWRYHPTRHEFEVFAHGTSNPWGLDFNDYGDWFISACVIPHLYHMIQGGRYQRQAGQHFNPATYDDIKTIADHAHYVGQWQSVRSRDDQKPDNAGPSGTSMLGGGHAHCGLAIYNGDVFPAEYHGELLFHNLHGHRVVREHVAKNGSGYVGQHRPDFALARDHKQIGVGVMVGPDGAIYTSDWHDIQTCHNRDKEVWDRTDGRLFRIRYGEVRPQSFDLWSQTDQELVQHLASNNGFFARQAQRILHERNSNAILPTLKHQFAETQSTRDRLRLMWTQFCVGGASEPELLAWMSHKDPYVRGWAVHLAGDRCEELSIRLLNRVSKMAAEERDLVVRRYLASLLQRLPQRQRWPILDGLAKHSMSAADHNLPMLVWYGLEPLAAEFPERAYDLARRSPLPNLAAFTVRRAAQTPAGREALISVLVSDAPTPERLRILREMLAVATSRGGTEMPENWHEFFSKRSRDASPEEAQLIRSLAVQFGDESIFPYFRERFANRQLPTSQRLDALTALRTANDPTLPEQIFSQLDDPSVSSTSVAALARFDTPQIADRLLEMFDSFDAMTKTASLGTLASRASTAARLVDAMEDGTVDPRSVPAFIVQQLLSLKQTPLNVRIEKVWGRIASSSTGKKTDKKAEYEKYNAILTPRFLAKADASAGRVLYEANCGKCHRMFGVGGDIGPDITGANRTSVNYWLENILEPNSLIGLAYQVNRFLTVDGRVIAGMMIEENDEAVTVQTATEKIVLSREDIEEQTLAPVSLMPEGQLQPMSDQDVANLFRYLMSPSQIRLPLSDSKPNTYRSRPDAHVIEGESLLPVSLKHGVARAQAMKHFGPEWSGDRQLWWTGGRPGATLTLPLSTKREGKFDVIVFFTQAHDYAQIEAEVKGNEAKPIDLFDETVSLAKGVRWTSVNIEPGSVVDLRVTITGANSMAKPSYMVGIDRIEFIPSGGSDR